MIRKILKKIDETLFKGIIKKNYHKFNIQIKLKKLKHLNYTLTRKEKKSLLLADLIYKCPEEGVVVECGVGVGATLMKIAKISKKKYMLLIVLRVFLRIYQKMMINT